jgi:hypothetical protein
VCHVPTAVRGSPHFTLFDGMKLNQPYVHGCQLPTPCPLTPLGPGPCGCPGPISASYQIPHQITKTRSRAKPKATSQARPQAWSETPLAMILAPTGSRATTCDVLTSRPLARKAAPMASATRFPTSGSDTMATAVGPAPLMVHPKAPAAAADGAFD